jgi:hypothetical protein
MARRKLADQLIALASSPSFGTPSFGQVPAHFHPFHQKDLKQLGIFDDAYAPYTVGQLYQKLARIYLFFKQLGFCLSIILRSLIA